MSNGDFMKKYLITIDLDGTLLTSEAKLTSAAKAYLKELKNTGHKIVLATGRPYRGVKAIYDELELDTPLVYDNGTCIESEKATDFKSFSNPIKKEILDDLFLHTKDNIITAFYIVDNNHYVYNYAEAIEFYYFINEKTVVHEGPLNNPKYQEATNAVIAVSLDYMEEFESYIKNTLTEIDYRYWYKDNSIVFYEVFLKGFNKGTALKTIREFYNIPKQLTISFGDGGNDVELLKESGHGVKMSNGSYKLDHVYDDVTTFSNDEDGVIKYLKTFLK